MQTPSVLFATLTSQLSRLPARSVLPPSAEVPTGNPHPRRRSPRRTEILISINGGMWSSRPTNYMNLVVTVGRLSPKPPRRERRSAFRAKQGFAAVGHGFFRAVATPVTATTVPPSPFSERATTDGGLCRRGGYYPPAARMSARTYKRVRAQPSLNSSLLTFHCSL